MLAKTSGRNLKPSGNWGGAGSWSGSLFGTSLEVDRTNLKKKKFFYELSKWRLYKCIREIGLPIMHDTTNSNRQMHRLALCKPVTLVLIDLIWGRVRWPSCWTNLLVSISIKVDRVDLCIPWLGSLKDLKIQIVH